MFALFMLFLLSFIVFFILTLAVRKFFPKKKKKIYRLLLILFMVSTFYIIWEVGQLSKNIPFAPIYLSLSLFILFLMLVAIIYNQWVFSKPERSIATPLKPFLKANFWLYSRMISHIIIPIFLCQLPVYNINSRIIYWGVPLFILLLYRLYFKVYLPALFDLVKLNVDPDFLSKDIREKFYKIIAPIEKLTDCRILISKEGLHNAVALYPLKQIVIGIDLVRHLTCEENRAVLLHEIGHQQDKQYLPSLYRRILFCDASILLIGMMTQFDFSFENYLWIGFVLILYMFFFRFGKLKLKSEYVADQFVKDYDEELHAALISGLEKLRKMNALDKDYCKDHNIAHLDIDERQQMVAEGRYIARPWKMKGLKNFLFYFIIIILSIFCFHFFNRYLPTTKNKWRNLHDQYHSLKNKNHYDEATVKIKKAISFSNEHFGAIHNKTYISLNDLTDIYITTSQWDRAEEIGLKAYETGEKLYNRKNLKCVRSILNLGEIQYYRRKYVEAEKWYNLALSVQQNLGDKDNKIISTLHWLISLYQVLNKDNQVIASYEKILDICGSKKDKYFDTRISTLLSLGRFYNGLQNDLKADEYFNTALSLANEDMELENEITSFVYIAVGNYYSRKNFKKAEKILFQSADRYRKKFGEENEGVADVYTHLGHLYKNQKKYDLAEKYYTLSMKINEKLYKGKSWALKYICWDLAKLHHEAGDLVKSKMYYKKILDMKDTAYDDSEEKLLICQDFITLLTELGETKEIAVIEEQVRFLQQQEKAAE